MLMRIQVFPTARTHQLALPIFSYSRNRFQRDPPLDGSLDSGIFSATIRIATPVTLPTISACDG
jgi:hypothetical protein